MLCDHAGTYAIAESGLPEGVLPAENDSVQVQAAPGSAAEVAFEHPAPGLVQAAATLVSVNALGEQEEKPLAGLALCVAGQTATTDADGAASLNLPEGTYDAQLVYTVREASFCRLHRGRSSCAAAKPRAWKCRPQVLKDALRFKRKAGAR